uniref:Uncharacterized protein n=1 Tax=Anguilla anguilla TaxID=7936 RepID=A0A0E9QXH5_ANGAN
MYLSFSLPLSHSCPSTLVYIVSLVRNAA